ncbi:hypothetical protein ACX80T_07020 [Arthrobacter sp. Sr33]
MQDRSSALTDDDDRRPAVVVVSQPMGTAVGDRPARGNAHHQVIPLWWAFLVSLALGLAVAVLGTALHGQQWDFDGLTLPVGAAAAVLLAGSVAVFVALWARNVYFAPVVGGVAYLVVGLFAASEDQPLVLTDLGMEPLLPSAVAGSIWVFGLAVVTVAASMVSWWVLRPRRAIRPV